MPKKRTLKNLAVILEDTRAKNVFDVFTIRKGGSKGSLLGKLKRTGAKARPSWSIRFRGKGPWFTGIKQRNTAISLLWLR